MYWIYLSPHIDDAILSSGGLIYEQIQAGDRVEIWTLFSADPPPGQLSAFAQELHEQWGAGAQSYALRRAEDLAACVVLGAVPRHLGLPEVIYRRLPGSGEPVIQRREELFQPIAPGERSLIPIIADLLRQQTPEGAQLVSPLSAGGHVDHRLVRAAAQTIRSAPLWYYADYPYSAQEEFGFRLRDWVAEDWQVYTRPISAAGLAAWQQAVSAYTSQLSTFWEDEQEMRAAIAAYRQMGSALYQPFT